MNHKRKEKTRSYLINELYEHLTPAKILYSSIEDLTKLRQELRFKKVVKFVDEHIKNVGYEQAVKDLQVGLTILNGCQRNSPCECKNALKYDGIFGDKTKATLNDACKNYSVNIIEKYIIKGIENNIIFDTKNRKNTDTERLMEETCLKLKNLKEEKTDGI